MLVRTVSLQGHGVHEGRVEALPHGDGQGVSQRHGNRQSAAPALCGYVPCRTDAVRRSHATAEDAKASKVRHRGEGYGATKAAWKLWRHQGGLGNRQGARE